MILFQIIFFLLHFSLIWSCGMSTHIEINYRAIHWLNSTKSDNTLKFIKILQNYSPSWEAGSFFPDWGFGCNKYHDASEEAHWPPFYSELIEHIRTKYPNSLFQLQAGSFESISKSPHNEGFFKIVSFLFGMVGHGVADVLFHDLDHRGQGLIRAFSHLNWNHDYYKAHQSADFSGDLMLSHRYNLDYYSTFWYTPTSDIVKIYKRMGYSQVNSILINSCMSLGFVAAKSNAQQGRLLFGKFDLDKSPFMIQQFENYFKGGVMSMSFNVYECWLELIDMLLYDKKFAQFCEKIFPDYRLQKTSKQLNWTISNLFDSQDVESNDLNEPIQSQSSCIRIGEESGILRVRSILGSNDYERFGSSLISGDFNGDGLNDLVVSSPYHFNHFDPQTKQYSVGKVSIYSGGSDIVKLHRSPKVILNSPSSFASHSNYGFSLAVLDANGDGIDDLIVGAPLYQPTEELKEEYAGNVFIYYGHKNWQMASDQFETLPIPKSIKHHNYTQFGSKLFTMDINQDGFQDLIVGLPYSTNVQGRKIQSGQVCAFFNSQEGLSRKPEWCVSSPNPQSYEQFGYHIKQKYLFDNRTSLLIGAPGYQNTDHVMLGRIYSIDLDIDGKPTFNRNKVLEGFNDRMQIGRSFDVDTNQPSKVMLVSASSEDSSSPLITHWQAGKVYKYDFNLQQLELITKGSENGGQLGSDIIFQSQVGWWVTEPGKNGENGCIRRINEKALDQSICFEPTTQLGRFGSSLLVQDLDGDGIPDLVIGEPYHSAYLDDRAASSQTRSQGRINILFSIPAKIPSNLFKRISTNQHIYYRGLPLSIWTILMILGLTYTIYRLRQGQAQRAHQL